ncbi:hypothetical protein [Candidatus Protochlamydia phocaeensis]|uniref:hypothetical protein n=1 Tax=Candidatus Protochlamydia phocaeensis TaxID=1414722 RepID=UPI000838D7C2|nr:hypothetical protein [Candidatus Protochlamydia phocaeensis]
MSAISFLTLPNEIIAYIALMGDRKTLIALSSSDKLTKLALDHIWKSLVLQEFPDEYKKITDEKPSRFKKLKEKFLPSNKSFTWKQRYSEANYQNYLSSFKTELKPISALQVDPAATFAHIQLSLLQSDGAFANYIQFNPRMLLRSYLNVINEVKGMGCRFIHFNAKGEVSEIQDDYNPAFGMPSGVAIVKGEEKKIKAKLKIMCPLPANAKN